MPYHFGRERRRGSDRRIPRDVAFAGIERRITERRALRREREGPFSKIVIGLILLILFDAMVWHGYYRSAVIRGLNHQAASVRNWSDNVWDWKSDR